LNGYYPGSTGHAVIANELVPIVNSSYRTALPPIEVQAVMAVDPVARYQAAQGPAMSWEQVSRPTPEPVPSPSTPVGVIGAEPPPATDHQPNEQTASSDAIRLPPGLEQSLPLNKHMSYHGDGIRIVHCQDDNETKYGGCGNLLFGGLALFGSHLT